MTDETQNENPGGGQDTGTQAPDFGEYKTKYLDSLSDQTQRETFEKGLDGIKSWDSLIASNVNAQKLIGSKISLPKDDSPEEDWNNLYNKLGRPETPESYDLTNEKFKYTEEVEKEIRQSMHKLGLTAKQAKGINDTIATLSAQSKNQQEELKTQNTEAILTERKELFKEDLAQAETEAEEFVRQLLGKEDKEDLEKVKASLASDNTLLKLFRKAYQETAPKNPAAVARNIEANQTSEEFLHNFFKDKENKLIYQREGYAGFPKHIAEKLRNAMINK